MNAMILCAGLGMRFKPVSEKTAKPAIPFLNVPLLGYSLAYLESLGMKNLVINTHHLPKTIQAAADKILKTSYKTTFLHEPKILGSGGGIKNAEAILKSDGDFTVLNGDSAVVFNHSDGLSRVLAFHRANSALATLLTTEHPEAGRSLGGVWADDAGRITRLGVKDPATADKAKHFCSVFIFSPRIFDFMPKGSGEFHIFRECLEPAIKAGEKILAYNEPGLKWFDMTDLRQHVEATAAALDVLRHDDAYSKNLWAIQDRFGQKYERTGEAQWIGPKGKFSGALKPGAKLLMAASSTIDAGVEVAGFAVLGEGARFSQGFIESSTIAGGVHVNELVAVRRQLII